MPEHIEFTLPFLIERSGIAQSRADRRLNGIENALAGLVRRWRPIGPLNAWQELRMCAETALSPLAWIVAERAPDKATRSRLAVYQCRAVNDETVPAGWVQLQLPRSAE